jgi:iron complex outermembrane receptor protein
MLAISASSLFSGIAIASDTAGVESVANAAPADVGTQAGQDIVVTARRSAESVQSVPISITAFSQDMLRQKNIATANDLDKAVPGLTVAANQGNPGIPAFAIRGRGLNFGAAAGAVETYFADVPLSMPQAAFALPPQFFDIGSFQVLKGPQGTLFGRSTTGGAVVIVPHAVENSFSAYGRLQGGSYNNIQAEGAINIPLVDGIAGLRLAGFYWKRDGYSRVLPGNIDRLHGTSLDGERYNNQDLYELRGTLKLTPADGFENTTIVTYHSDAIRGSAGAGIRRIGALGGPYVPSNGFGTLWSDSDVRFHDQARNWALAVVNTTTVEASDSLTLKNIFGLISSKGMTSQATNGDGSALQTVSLPGSPSLVETQQYTNEFQLQGTHFDDRFKWITGILFDITRQPLGLDHLNVASLTYATPPAGCVAPTCVYINTRYGSNKTDSVGMYASGSFKILPDLTVSAGFRRSWDQVKLYGGNVFNTVTVSPSATPPLTALPPNKLTVLNDDFAGNTYNADISYQATRDVMIYSGFRHGYKRGGFQSSGLTRFNPETVNNYYLGVKSAWNLGGHHLRANVEIYHDSYSGQQVSYTTLTPAGTLQSLTDNIDKSSYQGIDVDVNLDVTQWWNVAVNYGYIDAKIKKWADRTVAGSTVDLTRNPIPYVPKHKLSATNRFDYDTGFADMALQGSVNYQTKYYTGPLCVVYPQGAQNAVGGFDFNAIAVGGCTVPGHTTLDARLEFNNIAGTRFSVAANVTNFTNKIYWTGTSNTTRTGVEGFAYAPPRMWTIEASFRF